MNRKLLDASRLAALPEAIEEYLEYGIARSCAFNRRGTLLATGTEDGYILVWDFETRGIVKIWAGHSIPPSSQEPRSKAVAASVTSLAWSRNGRHLLSGSLDKRLILWDITKPGDSAKPDDQGTPVNQAKVLEVPVPGTINHVCLSPRKPYKAVASLLQTAPVLVDLESREVTSLPSVDFKEGKGGLDVIINSTAAGFALLSKSCKEVYLGQLRGIITVYDTETHKVLEVFKLPGSTPVKIINMFLNRKGDKLLLNCSDKTIRMMDIKPRPEAAKLYSHEELKTTLSSVEATRTGSLLQDADSSMLQLSELTFSNNVLKDQWRATVMTNDSEYVAAIVASKSEHLAYVWEAKWGNLVRILQGPKSDSAHDLAWHPVQSCLITLTSTGKAYIWTPIWDEYWSSFAPDFYEMHENTEYVEREDEFDLNEKPADGTAANGQDELEAADVDVLTKEFLPVFSSDEEDEALPAHEAALHWLPAEVNLGQVAAGADQEQQQQQQLEEGQDESSEETSDEDEKQEPEIIDGPRKRKVRFDITAADDLADLDLEGPQPVGANRSTSSASRGRGRGRRGRPPRGGGAAAAGASNSVGRGGAGVGLYGVQNPVAYPGNALPGQEGPQQGSGQHQQMYGGWGMHQQQWQ